MRFQLNTMSAGAKTSTQVPRVRRQKMVSNGSEALNDLSSENLAAAVERNSAEWIRLQGRLPWVEFHEEPDALWVMAGDTWPRNSVALARFTPATAAERILEILAPHLSRRVACNWIVGPVSEPADLSRQLRAHGF